MKVVLVLLLAVVGSFAQAPSQYPTRYDNIDVKGILENRILLKRYINCMLDKGPCDNEGNTLKRILPDALMTGCSKCNDKQRTASRQVIVFLMKNKPDEWKLLTDKYDKNGQYEKNYKGLL